MLKELTELQSMIDILIEDYKQSKMTEDELNNYFREMKLPLHPPGQPDVLNLLGGHFVFTYKDEGIDFQMWDNGLEVGESEIRALYDYLRKWLTKQL